MSDRKMEKLLQYIQQGKVLVGSSRSESEGKPITTTVSLQRLPDDLYEVDIETYYSTIDVRELNIRDDSHRFTTLEAAISFIEQETGIKFAEMHR